jgi:hypothetical protein
VQQLGQLLQQGYRLDYTSTLPADDATHPVTVSLVGSGLEAEATGSLVAQSSPITVTVPNLTEGQTVGGSIDLTAQAESAAPLASVVYRLNGDVLAEVDDTSFTVLWNSDTVEPGSYTLEVTVEDAAGNEGVTTVDFVVVPPLTVTAQLAGPSSDGELFVGDEVTVQADVEAISGEARVEVYVDEVLVGADNTAPYSVSFDTSELAAGPHTITVVATDGEGHEARTTLEMPLAALPLPTPAPTAQVQSSAFSVERVRSIDWRLWLGYIGTGLVLLAGMLVLLGLTRTLSRASRQQKLTAMRLTITNLGNVATGYLLRGDDPAGILSFRFSHNGVALGLPPVARFDRGTEPGAAAVSGAAGPVPRTSVPGLPAGAGGLSMPKGVGDVMGRLDEVSTVSRLIADILMSISYFLPRSLAQPVRNVVMQIRKGQMLARRVQHVQRQVDRLNQTELGSTLVEGTTETATQLGRAATSEATREAVYDLGRSAGSVATSGRTAANPAYELSGAPTRSGATAAPGSNGGAMAAAAATTAVAASGRQWVYLPSLNPGETAAIEVLVGMQKKVNKSQHVPFRLISRALGTEDAQPVVEEGSIRMEGASPWRRFLWLIILLVVIVVVASLIWLLVTGLF